MKYPPVHKDVDGYKCPEVFHTAMDLMSYDCSYCGRGKHYGSCCVSDAQACFGWGVQGMGAMSCKGYVKFKETQKDFL